MSIFLVSCSGLIFTVIRAGRAPLTKATLSFHGKNVSAYPSEKSRGGGAICADVAIAGPSRRWTGCVQIVSDERKAQSGSHVRVSAMGPGSLAAARSMRAGPCGPCPPSTLHVTARGEGHDARTRCIPAAGGFTGVLCPPLRAFWVAVTCQTPPRGADPRPGGGATSHAVLVPHTASCSEGPGPNLRSGNLQSFSASLSLGPPAARGHRLLTVPSRGHHCLPRHEATTPGSCRLPPCGPTPSPEPETSSLCNTLPPVLPDPSFGVFKAHSNPG